MTIRKCLIGCGLLLLLTSAFLGQIGRSVADVPNPVQVAELVLANHILANEGVIDAYGHVSVRDERNPNHSLVRWAHKRNPHLASALHRQQTMRVTGE